ncbi:type II secretion system protein GspC [Vibrio sp. S9_S30]|uniref:type II secretion system protein GspC n=1 Tax=Vibrio sp. S9_S30 TaxID=2720226 RepID=UPI0016810884|nr:type II secretion system protein GspC [Vibrio sp. S9_S30]MBD1558631.1 type II secretion system protein GspC [Vibrio sp. S9_S30]
MSSSVVQKYQLDQKFTAFLTFIVKRQGKLSAWLTLLLIAISAWIVGQLSWQWVPQDTGKARWSPTTVVSQAGPGSNDGVSGDAIASLLDAHLFGRYSDKPEAQPKPKPVVKDAPKTRLSLVLVGVVASSPEDRSLAVIANRGQQQTYGIGEQIEGTSASLKGVWVDRVIIDNQGQDETLMFEGVEYSKLEPKDSFEPQDSPAPPPSDDSNIGNLSDVNDIEQVRREISQNPQQIMQYIRLSQVRREDKIIGYRVGPGSQRELFDAVGLKDGDIATQLNGADLSDPSAMGKVWQTISDMTELNLTVERDGQRHEIFIEF